MKLVRRAIPLADRNYFKIKQLSLRGCETVSLSSSGDVSPIDLPLSFSSTGSLSPTSLEAGPRLVRSANCGAEELSAGLEPKIIVPFISAFEKRIDVDLWHKADVQEPPMNVRYWGYCGHPIDDIAPT